MNATTADKNADYLSACLVETIATHDNTDPLAMEPLYDVVDLEALESLVERGTDVRVSFEYAGHTVVVTGDCTVSVDGETYDDFDAGGDQA